MNYISKKIDDRLSIMESIGNTSDILTQYQAKLEFFLVFILGYLWNKNFEKLDESDKEMLFNQIQKPTIGDIVAICRKLDYDNLIRKNKRLSKTLEDYPQIRNNNIGHGYIYEDGVDELLSKLIEMCDAIQESNIQLLNDLDIIIVVSKDGVSYKGWNCKFNGSVIPWCCPLTSNSFEEGNVYIVFPNDKYERISPFVEIKNYGNDIYIYCSVAEKLLGKVKYNKLLETGTLYKNWESIAKLCITNDGEKIKTGNGTIINVFEPNYTKYIGIGIKENIKKFLIGNKASVCATIWGHGGVGKTATMQSVCEDLANETNRHFDYILFLSAKDRRYNPYKGCIEQISDSLSTFEELISNINSIVFDSYNTDESAIIAFDGKILIVIDDYETFSKENKEKIELFIQKLNTDHHKVIVTTRAASINLGVQFPNNELSEKDAVEFLLHVVENEHLGNKTAIEKNMKSEKLRQLFYSTTNGRPLFIYQFAYILAQKGIEEALERKINEQKEAIDFLYGRLYDYLSPKAKDLFVILSLLVDAKNTINVIDKAQYILNMDGDDDGFYAAVTELEKLKIIRFEDEEKRFFEVYSNEILQMMNIYYQKRDDSFKGGCNRRREQINRDRELDVEHSLLLTADANRVIKNEIEVIDNYKQILNRSSAPINIKLSAILNLASYLVIDKGKKDLALKYFEEYSRFFSNIPSKDTFREKFAQYTKMWATYTWSNGDTAQRHKAVEILLNYAHTGFNYRRNYDLELAGMLLQYNSILLITEWQDLKDKRQFDEISESDFKEQRKKQMIDCANLHNKYGKTLYLSICKRKLTELSSGARQNVVAGLYNYTDILVRIHKYSFALEICQYILYNATTNYHMQFEKKRIWIEQISQQKSNYILLH